MSRDYAPRPGGVYYNRSGDGGDGGMDQMHHQMQMQSQLASFSCSPKFTAVREIPSQTPRAKTCRWPCCKGREDVGR
jgi:hypothetical protein